MTPEAGETSRPRHTKIIDRPRLTRRLDQAGCQIILLVAPAGYGKTTLAREWLRERPHVWYRGTPAASDVAALALGLARATSKIVPGANERLAARLRLSKAPAEEVSDLAELLAEDLAGWPRHQWLAFDDYQFACDSDTAEHFVEHLAANCQIRLLVASRTRPRWATARRTLYGEIFEVGRTLLAMNDAEAEAVCSLSSPTNSDALLSLADGWPALIGLATISGDPSIPAEALPAELYSFFAEELYQAAEPDLQQALRRLALAPYVTQEIANVVIGQHPDRLIDKGRELGFFLPSREPLELHPLLRTFLCSKFTRALDDPTGHLLRNLVEVLVASEEWDEVFALASRFADPAILATLFDASLPQILDQARLPTLEEWIAVAKSLELDSPVVNFAEAELYFRRGELAKAEVLAFRAASRLENHSFASRAYWLAGTSAHVSVNDEVAAQHFAAAEDTARSDADKRAAVWGRFLAAEALERGQDARRLLREFEQRSTTSVDDLLRIATGRLLIGSMLGGAREVLRDQRGIVHLAERSRDPLIASAYFNAHAWLLVLSGQYQEALEAADAQKSLAALHSLDFVMPFAFLHTAAARWGLRNFRASRANLATCERSTSNHRLLAIAGQLLCRLHLADARPEEALRALELKQEVAKASPTLYAEHIAWQSLAHAIAGNNRAAVTLSRQALSLSRRLDVSGLIPWVDAVIASRSRYGLRSARSAFRVLISSGNVDALVATYRAYPYLLELIRVERQSIPYLETILGRARDHVIAQQVGIHVPAPQEHEHPCDLSKREREVLRLVCQGFLNKEIARALFITEATVKVHVRNICRKLGVRTRTEAAMRAAEISG